MYWKDRLVAKNLLIQFNSVWCLQKITIVHKNYKILYRNFMICTMIVLELERPWKSVWVNVNTPIKWSSINSNKLHQENIKRRKTKLTWTSPSICSHAVKKRDMPWSAVWKGVPFTVCMKKYKSKLWAKFVVVHTCSIVRTTNYFQYELTVFSCQSFNVPGTQSKIRCKSNISST